MCDESQVGWIKTDRANEGNCEDKKRKNKECRQLWMALNARTTKLKNAKTKWNLWKTCQWKNQPDKKEKMM